MFNFAIHLGNNLVSITINSLEGNEVKLFVVEAFIVLESRPYVSLIFCANLNFVNESIPPKLIIFELCSIFGLLLTSSIICSIFSATIRCTLSYLRRCGP